MFYLHPDEHSVTNKASAQAAWFPVKRSLFETQLGIIEEMFPLRRKSCDLLRLWFRQTPEQPFLTQVHIDCSIVDELAYIDWPPSMVHWNTSENNGISALTLAPPWIPLLRHYLEQWGGTAPVPKALSESSTKAMRILQHLDTTQRESLDVMAGGGLFVLHGAAGTGKSHVLRMLARDRKRFSSHIVGVALTHRQVSAMRQRGIPVTQTIHRTVLQALDRSPSVPEPPEWKDAKTILVEEVSMLSPELLCALFWAIEHQCQRATRLILIGDPGQLPPVGSAAYPLACFAFRPVNVSRIHPSRVLQLQTVYRTQGHSMLQSSIEALMGHGIIRESPAFTVRDTVESSVWSELNTCLDELKEEFGNSILVMTPYRQVFLQELETYLRGRHRGDGGMQSSTLHRGDMVIVRSVPTILPDGTNPLAVGIAPGTIFQIHSLRWRHVDDTEHITTPSERMVDLDRLKGDPERSVEVILTMIGQQSHAIAEMQTMPVLRLCDVPVAPYEVAATALEPQFAGTNHETQGLEARAAVYVIPDIPHLTRRLTRPHLYTAATRAKERFVVIGARDVVSDIASRAPAPVTDCW